MAKDEKAQVAHAPEGSARPEDDAPGAAATASSEASSAADGAAGAGADEADKAAGKGGVTRRALLIGGASTAVLLGLGALRYVGHTPVVRPPGGADESHLVSACIRCEKCLEACPRRVIVPARIEDGLLGMRSPMLNFDNDYCDFCAEENGGEPLCVRTCPTGALSLSGAFSMHDAPLGIARIDQSQCLAFRDTGCRYCFDACEKAGYSAIELSGDGYSATPSVVAGKCVGCGACESVCVSLKVGSIAQGATERAIKVHPIDSEA